MTVNSNKTPAAKKSGKKILGLMLVIFVAFSYLIKVKYLNSLTPVPAEVKEVEVVSAVKPEIIQTATNSKDDKVSNSENFHSVRTQIVACFGDGFQLAEEAPTKEQLLSAFFGPAANARGMTQEHNWSNTHIKNKHGRVFILRDENEAPKVFREDEAGLPLVVELSKKERLMNFEQLLQHYLKKGEVIYRDSVNTFSLNGAALTIIDSDQGLIEFKYSGVRKHFECERESTDGEFGRWNCRCQSL